MDALQDPNEIHARYWFRYRVDAEAKAREMNEADEADRKRGRLRLPMMEQP